MKKSWLAVGIILLFVGTCIIPSVPAEQASDKSIITVDDEPGDADYTSIREAVNASNPGDTIEVYSGTYPEEGILLSKDNISLLGIAHELGGGNDTGKPFIQGKGFESVMLIEASHILVSNCTIENPETDCSTFTCGIFIERHPGYEQHHITIADCTITTSAHTGIYVSYTRDNVRICGNHIRQCFLDGITVLSYSPLSSFTITGNVVADCRDSGISFTGADHQNVSGNRIRNCSIGIEFGATNTTVYGNDIDSCARGIRCGGGGNTFAQNNFRNYSLIGFVFFRSVIQPGKNTWIGNYWDTWKGRGPKVILGFIVVEISIPEWLYLMFFVPWVECDWHPAAEPYDIPA
ncbi:MAG: right-handed parallel beta-helix repeat-containing protein [Candidatus Thermoplasmatota archaeon]|nr:right-handed parallel beta-helix repeat-containing protein [Candidatus Thermoplasmatota archaeon]